MQTTSPQQQLAERKVAFILDALNAGKTVYLTVYAGGTKLTKRQASQVRACNGVLEIQHGKKWLDYNAARITT